MFVSVCSNESFSDVHQSVNHLITPDSVLSRGGRSVGASGLYGMGYMGAHYHYHFSLSWSSPQCRGQSAVSAVSSKVHAVTKHSSGLCSEVHPSVVLWSVSPSAASLVGSVVILDTSTHKHGA